jgi:hypothetical protein
LSWASTVPTAGPPLALAQGPNYTIFRRLTFGTLYAALSTGTRGALRSQPSIWRNVARRVHGRGGFEQESLVDRSWSVVVDIVTLSMILWIASGLYMWWELPEHRRWGCLAILAGTVSFVILICKL